MFDVLLASGAPVELRPSWLTLSMTTHAVGILLAGVLTQAALDAARLAPPEEAVLLFVAEPPPPPPPPPASKAQTPPPSLAAEPPPKGFQTVAALQDIPTDIPPVDLTQRALDPRDFTGQGVEGGIAAGVVGGTGRVDEGSVGADAIYEATTTDDRFEQASVISQPPPRYPGALESLGIEGRVVVEFVIDTAGQVQPTTVRTLESTHPQFDAAARRAVQGSVFRPARMSGHPVRQRTRQSIRFLRGQ